MMGAGVPSMGNPTADALGQFLGGQQAKGVLLLQIPHAVAKSFQVAFG
ncbi:MAG: hypothetical protein IH987_16745 [Planctomycetes bacterium]|nr:hypothetical protein [Planctomycetota bacterium]